jgi:hypothetical protein
VAELARIVHPLVQDTNNQDAVTHGTIEDNVTLVAEAPIARANLIRRATHPRVLAQSAETAVQPLEIASSLDGAKIDDRAVED